jgi:hypothetical protein
LDRLFLTFLYPDRFQQSCDAEDADHWFEVAGEQMKAHRGTYPRQSFWQMAMASITHLALYGLMIVTSLMARL